jgi:hypothetical protein
MGGFYDTVARTVNERPLALGIGTPQNEYKPFALFGEFSYRRIREFFPSLILM